jgi:hypothetical protein
MNDEAKEVAKSKSQMPAVDEIEKLAQQDAGEGISQQQADKFYPIMSVLQKLSPQVDDTSPAYIRGAKAGTIWLRNFSPMELVPGDRGIAVQPVRMYIEWVEWIPRERGGGMVGRFLKRPDTARLMNAATNKWALGENSLQETRMWVVNVWHEHNPVPFIIPCQSTQNTFARQWNTIISQQFEPSGGISPAWRHIWRLTTKQRQNAKGQWYVFSFEHEGKVNDVREYMAGRVLNDTVKEALAQGLQLAETIHDEGDDDDRM